MLYRTKELDKQFKEACKGNPALAEILDDVCPWSPWQRFIQKLMAFLKRGS